MAVLAILCQKHLRKNGGSFNDADSLFSLKAEFIVITKKTGCLQCLPATCLFVMLFCYLFLFQRRVNKDVFVCKCFRNFLTLAEHVLVKESQESSEDMKQ